MTVVVHNLIMNAFLVLQPPSVSFQDQPNSETFLVLQPPSVSFQDQPNSEVSLEAIMHSVTVNTHTNKTKKPNHCSMCSSCLL